MRKASAPDFVKNSPHSPLSLRELRTLTQWSQAFQCRPSQCAGVARSPGQQKVLTERVRWESIEASQREKGRAVESEDRWLRKPTCNPSMSQEKAGFIAYSTYNEACAHLPQALSLAIAGLLRRHQAFSQWARVAESRCLCDGRLALNTVRRTVRDQTAEYQR